MTTDFTLAIAVQNLVWGFLQPLAGLWAARYGYRIVMTAGAVLYALGLLSLATATGYFGVMPGAGLLIGPALACIGSGIALAVASRPVPLAVRSTVLGLIYIVRSLMLAWYFAALPTPDSTILFAAVMGFLWLGVAPLVAGAVAEMLGLRWLAMIGGIAFMSHQLGSAVGAFGGGLLFDLPGSYSLAVQIGAGMGLTAGVLQVLAGLPRWPGARRAAH